MSDEVNTMNDAEKSVDPGPSLSEQLQAALLERDQFKDKWTRALADHDNYRRRVMREMDEDRKYAALPLLKTLLPAFDGLDRAVLAAAQTNNADELIGGVQLTIKQLEASLNGFGAKSIVALGQPFDPNLHEAISQAESADDPPMTVLHDVERGYMLHDRVVRPSKVVVSTKMPQGEQ
ncbi:MAG: nucleotide exchange factor GrpE [Planctomycetales bacterium]|jgi:molecular chaperone GrpE|nr:nucleotide exchange factor GrpE [Planctomycetales bacterium]